MALNTEDRNTAKAIARGVGDELRRTREARGMTRPDFVKQLPSGITDRTLLSYESGDRQLSVIRLIELSEALETGAPIILGQGLQRARVALQNLPLRVDLHRLLRTINGKYRCLERWAKTRMEDSENGIIEVLPTSLRELAASVGLPHQEVASYLAKFVPPSWGRSVVECLGSHSTPEPGVVIAHGGSRVVE